MDQIMNAIMARREGRHEAALALLLGLFDVAASAGEAPGAGPFITMFEWRQLMDEYAPARAALVAARDGQVARLLAGDDRFSAGDDHTSMGHHQWPQSRFDVIVAINDDLNDGAATYALFLRLQSLMPAYAEKRAWRVVPAMVEAGDFTLAERHLGDPLDRLTELNDLSHVLPLFPGPGTAPRLAAELSNFMKDVRLRAAILYGLGRAADADGLRSAALAGLTSDDMRAVARREAAVPGTILQQATEHQLADSGTG